MNSPEPNVGLFEARHMQLLMSEHSSGRYNAVGRVGDQMADRFSMRY